MNYATIKNRELTNKNCFFPKLSTFVFAMMMMLGKITRSNAFLGSSVSSASRSAASSSPLFFQLKICQLCFSSAQKSTMTKTANLNGSAATAISRKFRSNAADLYPTSCLFSAASTSDESAISKSRLPFRMPVRVYNVQKWCGRVVGFCLRFLLFSLSWQLNRY